MFVDSHCHLDFPDFAESPERPQGLAGVLQNMQDHQVTHALCVSVDLPDFPKVLALAEQHPNLFASVGVHPDYEDTPEPSVAGLCELAQHSKIIAIGETGLDYFRLKGDLDWQRERFRTHIRAARQTGKPLIIHTRAAGDDTLRILREEGAAEVGGVMHCFTESLAFAQAALDLGFYISFSGIVTFKNAADLRVVAQHIPLDRMLIETDSPYLAPVPMRGKTNEPAWVSHVGHFLADLRDLSPEVLGEATTNNFFTLFKQAQRAAQPHLPSLQ